MKQVKFKSRKGNEFVLSADENKVRILNTAEVFSNPKIDGEKIEWNAVRGLTKIDHLTDGEKDTIRLWFRERDERVAQEAQKENMQLTKNNRLGIFARRGTTEYVMRDDFTWKWHGDYSPHTKFDGLDSSRISVGGHERP